LGHGIRVVLDPALRQCPKVMRHRAHLAEHPAGAARRMVARRPSDGA
jgi:hypothetical protein